MKRRKVGGLLIGTAVVLTMAGIGRAAQGAEAPGVSLPDYEVVTLDNGLRVLLAEKHDVPLIAFHLRIAGGSIADAEGREGAAEVLAELIQKGAGERSALQFSQAVDSVGGRLTAAASSEALTVSGEFMSRDKDLMLELLSDILLRPALDEKEFEKIRDRQVQSIAAAKENSPNSVIQSYFEAALFADHPYGRGSDETSLAALTFEDVASYYRNQVGADRGILAVVGDFDLEEMRTDLEKALGGWNRAGSALPDVPVVKARSGRHVLLVDKPDATQTFFWIGNAGVARDDPERVALDVANTAFGGRFTSMLNSELRIETGLTYGARSALARRGAGGLVAITSFTKTESTEEAIDRALAVMARLRSDGLSEETLDSVKAYVTGLFPLRLETGDQLAARMTEIAFYDLDRSDVDEYGQTVMATEDEKVREVISRVYPREEDLTFVLIGRAEEIRDLAAKYGDVTEMSITDPRFSPGP